MPATISVDIALATKPTEAPVWTSVTAYVESVSLRRGRQGPLETAGAGSATVRLSNGDRRFDPRYTTGPYFGNLKPMRRLRIRAAHGGQVDGYDTAITADAPAGYWRLGESSGTTASDASGNARHGTYVGAVTLGQTGALTGDLNTAIVLNNG